MMHIAVRDFEHWRESARILLARGVPPMRARFIDAEPRRRSAVVAPVAPADADGPDGAFVVPRRFLTLAAAAAVRPAPRRWDLLYSLLWRLTHGEPALLDDPLDGEVEALESLAAEADRSHWLPAGVEPTARAPVPTAADAQTLGEALRTCRACARCAHGAPIATSPGGGPLLLVGEAPDGDALTVGRPLVGDAGRLLYRATIDADIPAAWVRATYAIKHAPPAQRATLGERRRDADACRPWLAAELALEPPSAIVCLGEVAARGVLGRHPRRQPAEQPHHGPGAVPVFVAPGLDALRLAEAAGVQGPWRALGEALVAARTSIEIDAGLTAPQSAAPITIGEPAGR